MVTRHRLGKTDRTIVEFLNCKDAEAVFVRKKNLKDVDSPKFLSEGTASSLDSITPKNNNDWRRKSRTRKKILIFQNLCPYYQHLYGLVKQKKTSLMFDFLVFNRIIHMRKLQNSHAIDITYEFDIWFCLLDISVKLI